MSHPETWDAFFNALAARANKEAGGLFMNGLKWVAMRVFWTFLIWAVIYTAGGWAALVAYIKSTK